MVFIDVDTKTLYENTSLQNRVTRTCTCTGTTSVFAIGSPGPDHLDCEWVEVSRDLSLVDAN
jgi:hypothetical protein